MKHRKAFVREERLIQIVNHIARKYDQQYEGRVTTSEVANWLDLSATQTRKLLAALVNQEVLEIEYQDYPGVCGKRALYGFTQAYADKCEEKVFRATPPRRRSIKINGQQMEIEGIS